jgi:hypothetical protein
MADNDPNLLLAELRDILREATGRHAEHLVATEQRQADTQKRLEDIVHSYRRMVIYFAYGVAGIIALGVIGVFLYVL